LKQVINSLILLVLLLSVSTHASAQNEALALNDKLTNITDSLYAKGQHWGGKFAEVSTTKKFKELIPYRKDLQRFIDASIARVKVMKDVGSSKELRTAIMHFLNYEKLMVSKGFLPLEKLNAKSTDKQINDGLNKLKGLAGDENKELAKVADAQKRYADASGFKIGGADSTGTNK